MVLVIPIPAWAASVPIWLVMVNVPKASLVTVSISVTPVSGAVPQLVTSPTTLKDTTERSSVAGPHSFLTVMQAVFVTTVVQGAELAAIGPHGPVPTTLKTSTKGPQLVAAMLVAGTATEVCAGTVPISMLVVITIPLATLVIVSVTTTPVRVAVPQLVTEPETVYEPVARSTKAGAQFLVTPMQ